MGSLLARKGVAEHWVGARLFRLLGRIDRAEDVEWKPQLGAGWLAMRGK